MRIPLADEPESDSFWSDERLLWNESYQSWIERKAPRIPAEPPLPLEDPDTFLRRVRAE
jgi:hypothetical protein